MYEYDIMCGISKLPFEIHTKDLTHTLKDKIYIYCWKFMTSQV